MISDFHNGNVKVNECPICFESFSEREVSVTPCGHYICSECVLNLLQVRERFKDYVQLAEIQSSVLKLLFWLMLRTMVVTVVTPRRYIMKNRLKVMKICAIIGMDSLFYA